MNSEPCLQLSAEQRDSTVPQDAATRVPPSQRLEVLLTRMEVVRRELEAARCRQLDKEARMGKDRKVQDGFVLESLARLSARVNTEKKSAERLVQEYDSRRTAGGFDTSELEGMAAKHIHAAENFVFEDVIWDTIKRCHGLVAVRKIIPFDTTSKAGRRSTPHALADAVVDGGAEWIKVVTTTERRLGYQMAAAGWDWEEDSDDDADEGVDSMAILLSDEDDGGNPIDIARYTDALVRAARENLHNYSRPRVRIILPRVSRGSSKPVDRFLDLLANIGNVGGYKVELIIECANDERPPLPPLDVAFANLFDVDPSFTSSLNIDCSVFMALGSDISHLPIESSRRQLEEQGRLRHFLADLKDEEENGPKVTTVLYPALRDHNLVCTQEAADTFLKIVLQLGSDSEKERARIFFPAEGNDSQDAEARETNRRQLVAAFRKLSSHPVPDDLQLPIRIVDSIRREDVQRLVDEGLSKAALRVVAPEAGINDVNVSTFLYSWKSGLTTVTANWEAAKRVQKVVADSHVVTGEEGGPQFWHMRYSQKLLATPRPVTDDPEKISSPVE